MREQAEAKKRAEQETEILRLASLKRYGLDQVLYGTPDLWRVKVAAELESYVTLKNFPSWITDSQAHALVRGKVDEVLQPFKSEEARREKKAQDERRVQQLIDYGKRHASNEIPSDWDWKDRQDAARAVEQMLVESVEPDWTEREVKRAVDEELDEWEDENFDDDEEEES